MRLTRLRAAHLWALNTTSTTENVQIDQAVLEHPGYTGWIEGEPVICGGVVIPWPGLGMAWATISLKATMSIGVFRVTKIALMKMAVKHQLHRVETVVNAESPRLRQFVNFASRLGFIHESTMEQYGPHGETYYKMVWFPPYQFSER